MGIYVVNDLNIFISHPKQSIMVNSINKPNLADMGDGYRHIHAVSKYSTWSALTESKRTNVI
jgi:hypothetical protein